jgi:AcrR family transcriptional regulator
MTRTIAGGSAAGTPAAPTAEFNDRLSDIFRQAAAVFIRKGYHATTMQDVADAVGLTKAGLYHYVRGKYQLLVEVMNFAMDTVDRSIIEPGVQIDDPEERLRFMLRRHAGLVDEVQEVTVLTEELTTLAEEDRQRIVARKRRYVEFLRDTLIQLARLGRLRELDPTVATLNVFATILGISRWYRPAGRLSADQIAEETAAFVLGGLLKDPPGKAAQSPSARLTNRPVG